MTYVDENGHVADLGGNNPAQLRQFDITGHIVTPAFTDCHQHLDKARTIPFAPNPEGTLIGAIRAYGNYARTSTADDLRDRALATIAQCLQRGTTAIRTHVNVDPDSGMTGMETLAAIRSDIADHFRMQLVAFFTAGATKDLEWLLQNAPAAVELADAIGGTPALASDPERYLDLLFDLAASSGKPLDLHMDEHLDPERHQFDAVLNRVRDFGLQSHVTLGHCSVLSAMAVEDRRRICDRMSELGVSVVTLPAANLYLQAREKTVNPPRGLTDIRTLQDAGIVIATASDNIFDPFVPIGSGDMAELARWTLVAAQLHPEDQARLLGMVSWDAAGIMGFKNVSVLEPGASANFVISDCRDVRELLAIGPTQSWVVSNGHLIDKNNNQLVEK